MTQDTALCWVPYIYQKMFPAQVEPYKLMVSLEMDRRNTNGYKKHTVRSLLMSRERQWSQHIKTNQAQGLLSKLHRKESFLWNLLSTFFDIQWENIQCLDFSRWFWESVRVCKKTTGVVDKTTSSIYWFWIAYGVWENHEVLKLVYL